MTSDERHVTGHCDHGVLAPLRKTALLFHRRSRIEKRVASAKPVPTKTQLPGSGVTVTGCALITTKSTPACSDEPDEGTRSAETDADALKEVPSDSMKLVGLKVALNKAEVKLSMLGN